MVEMLDHVMAKEATIAAGDAWLEGNLALPLKARGLVVFAHGSGSSRFSPRNRFVAQVLNAGGIGTLLVDLLTLEEGVADNQNTQLRFDIPFLTRRLDAIVKWVAQQEYAHGLPLGLFGASTGAAAALEVAARRRDIAAVVSRGGRPDLAMTSLAYVSAPVLLIVGGEDHQVLDWNREALRHLNGRSRLTIIAGATHLFEEPGALEAAAQQAADWFSSHFTDLHGILTQAH